MTLGQLIERLEREDQNKVLPKGFNEPHSYRGYYDELAFEPAENITVKEMLDAARGALETTYEGYKGGEYKMCKHTDVHLARYGDCGEGIGNMLLDLMMAQ